MSSQTRSWVAAIVKTGEELRIALELSEGHSIKCYSPMVHKWRKLAKHEAAKKGRSRELFSFALLPGYLFVSAQCDESLSRLLLTKHVYGVVRTSAGPCYAQDYEIQVLRDLEAEFDSNRPTELSAFEVVAAKLSGLVQAHLQGKRLKLVSGPFEGLLATFRNSSAHKLEVGLTLNGKSITASLDSVEIA